MISSSAQTKPTGERLQKVLAHAGVSSRRQAEQLIVNGRVRVNGEVVTELGTRVDPEKDRIEIDGRVVAGPETFEYYVVNKPPGLITTVRDPRGRPTVMRLLGDVRARVYPVGRLDQDSEGLLVLTNDGELAHRLTHPRYEIEKEYLVEIEGPLARGDLGRIRRGITSSGKYLRPRKLQVLRQSDGIVRVSVVLVEGKKREV